MLEGEEEAWEQAHASCHFMFGFDYCETVRSDALVDRTLF